MKKLTLLLLLMVSTNLLAEWTEVITYVPVTIYVDYQSIIRIGNKVEMSFLQDYKSVYTVGNIRMLSVKSRGEYFCEENKSRLLNYYWYSENMGQGNIVFGKDNVNDESRTVTGISFDDGLFKIACGEK